MIAFAVIASIVGVIAGLRIAGPVAATARGGKARTLVLVLAAGVAAGALGLYAVGGEPDNPGRPWGAVVAELEAAGPENLAPQARLALLRERVRRNPEDVDQLLLLGRALSSDGSHLEAVAMIERAARLRPDARAFGDLGQALVALNDGEVTPEARRAFRTALDFDSAWPEANFYLGLAAYQDGDRAQASEIWGATLAALAPENGFRPAIAERAADLLSRPQAGPVSEQDSQEPAPPIAAAGGAEALARNMAERLEARLNGADSADFAGWLTLARTRAVLDEPSAAAYALGRAREALEPGDPRTEIVDALAAGLSIEEGET